MKTQTVVVPVQFAGAVAVTVPARLSEADAKLLAEKLAVARVLAVVENLDAPEAVAYDEYRTECSAGARRMAARDWDSATLAVSGAWSSAAQGELEKKLDDLIAVENQLYWLGDQGGIDWQTENANLFVDRDKLRAELLQLMGVPVASTPSAPGT